MGSLSSIAARARQSAADIAFEARVLHGAGILEPTRPDKAAKIGTHLPALGGLAGDRGRDRARSTIPTPLRSSTNAAP